MTLEDFVRNNRGINQDKARNVYDNLPRSLLEEVYRTIAAREIRMLAAGLGAGEDEAMVWDLGGRQRARVMPCSKLIACVSVMPAMPVSNASRAYTFTRATVARARMLHVLYVVL